MYTYKPDPLASAAVKLSISHVAEAQFITTTEKKYKFKKPLYKTWKLGYGTVIKCNVTPT